jgi:Chaperone of endosialidase
MRNRKSFALGLFTALVFVCLQITALGQAANDKLANVAGGGSSVRWDVSVSNSGGSLTISAPDGRVFYKEFRAGASPEINLTDKQLEKLPDGTYSYELSLRPVLSPGVRKALQAARGSDDDPEAERAGRKRTAPTALVQSGSFSILNGAIIVGGAVEDHRRTAKITEPQRTPGAISGNTVTRLRNHRVSLLALPDIVQPDDVIIQGSLCVGLDCVSGEVFGFDTIRTKENNTRIQFDDTSGAGFPTNNWQIRANSSAAGGASFLAFVDQGATGNSETGTIVFEVDAGAPANSLKVSSTGRVGLRTATPVLDLHITTGDTPAHRLEQSSQGGFTAQTWDIAGNEANFFVRDVTGGSRLPFRIRPGAPTSSIDISASGNVGIGTSGPAALLSLHKSTRDLEIRLADAGSTPAGDVGVQLRAGAGAFLGMAAGGGSGIGIVIDTSNNVGIGTTGPTALLSVNGTANKPGGGAWDVFSDERLKKIKGNFNSGLKAVMQLQPIRYQYKQNNALGLKSETENVGFGAQSLQKIIPEAVTQNSNGYLMVNNDPILWTMLNAIKEQQKEIAELKSEVQKLRAASHRRRK